MIDFIHSNRLLMEATKQIVLTVVARILRHTHYIDSYESTSSAEDNCACQEFASDVEDSDIGNATPPRQCLQKEWRARQLPDNIPWDAI